MKLNLALFFILHFTCVASRSAFQVEDVDTVTVSSITTSVQDEGHIDHDIVDDEVRIEPDTVDSSEYDSSFEDDEQTTEIHFVDLSQEQR